MAALVSSRSTGSMPSPSNHARTSAPLTPGAGEVVGLREEDNLPPHDERDHHAVREGQVVARDDHRPGGRHGCRPSTVGRSTARPSGGRTRCTRRKSMWVIVPRGSAPRTRVSDPPIHSAAAGCPPRGRPGGPRHRATAAASRRPAPPATTAPAPPWCAMTEPTSRGPPRPSRCPTTSAMAPYVVTRPRGTARRTAARARRTPRGRSADVLTSTPAASVAEVDDHQARRRRDRPPSTGHAGARSASRPRTATPRDRHRHQGEQPAPHPQRGQPRVDGRSAGPYDSTVAATCAAASSTPTTSTPPVARTPCAVHQPARPAPCDHDAGGGVGSARPPRASSTTTSDDHDRRRHPGRASASAAHGSTNSTAPQRHVPAGQPGGQRGAHRAPHLRQLGAAGEPVQDVVEGAGAPPRHDRAAERGEPLEQLVALDRRIRHARLGNASRSLAHRGRVAGRVSMTITERRWRCRLAVAVTIGVKSIGDSTYHHGARARPELEPLRAARSRVSGPHPGERAQQLLQVPLSRRRAVRAHRRPPTTRSPTRSPVRTWCSASAAAARTVTSRRAGRTVDAAGDADVAQARRRPASTPASCSARVVDDVQLAGAQRDPPVDPLAAGPRWNGRIPANSVPLAQPPRPVPADQAVGLRHLGPAVERRRLRQHGQLVPGQCRPAPSGSPAHALVSATFSAPMRAAAPAPRAELERRQAVVDQRPRRCRAPVAAATYGAGAATRVTCSTSVERRRPPAGTWCPGPRAGDGGRCACGPRGRGAGGRSSPSAARTTNGAASTTSTSRPEQHRRRPGRRARAGRPGRAPASAARWSPAPGLQGARRRDRRSAPRRRPGAPDAWVIQSSGLTVIRCASTARATTLTSSGTT